MGTIFCSYIFNNQISRLRYAILNSRLDDIKEEVKSTRRKSRDAFTQVTCHLDNDGAGRSTIVTTARSPLKCESKANIKIQIQQQSPDEVEDDQIDRQTPSPQIVDSPKDDDASLSKDSENLLNRTIDTYGNTPLLFSIQHCKLDSFKLLLNELKVDPNKPNVYTFYTPLHVCCLLQTSQPTLSTRKFNQERIFRSKSSDNVYNLKEGHNAHDNNHNKHSNLNRFKSVTFRSKKVKLYSTESLKAGSINNLNDMYVSKEEVMNLKNYVPKETLVCMISTLARKGANLNSIAKVNKITRLPRLEGVREVTPLLVAVYNQNIIAVEQLIKLGCNYNYQEVGLQLSALHMASYFCRTEIINVMIKNCAKLNVEAVSRNGFNCLHWLAISDQEENDVGIVNMIVNYLFRSHEKKEAMYENSEIFLQSLEKIMKNFLNKQSNDAQQSPLMLACIKNKFNLVKTLLDYDVSIDLKDKYGFTAINYAKNNKSLIDLLNSFGKIRKITQRTKSIYLSHKTLTNRCRACEIDSLDERLKSTSFHFFKTGNVETKSLSLNSRISSNSIA